jgi:hypothetical protein
MISRAWTRENVHLPHHLSRGRYRGHQSQRRTTKGHAPQILPRVRFPPLILAPPSNVLTDCRLSSRTGIVYNVTPNAVGVIVNKVVGNRYIEKRVNLRVEHVRHSKCRQEFLDRVKRNHDIRVEAKEKGGE